MQYNQPHGEKLAVMKQRIFDTCVKLFVSEVNLGSVSSALTCDIAM